MSMRQLTSQKLAITIPATDKGLGGLFELFWTLSNKPSSNLRALRIGHGLIDFILLGHLFYASRV